MTITNRTAREIGEIFAAAIMNSACSPVEVKTRPGLGTLYAIKSSAQELDFDYREVRANYLLPQEVRDIPYVGGDGKVAFAKFSPEKALELTDKRTIVVIDTDGAHQSVIDAYSAIDRNDVTVIHLSYA